MRPRVSRTCGCSCAPRVACGFCMCGHEADSRRPVRSDRPSGPTLSLRADIAATARSPSWPCTVETFTPTFSKTRPPRITSHQPAARVRAVRRNWRFVSLTANFFFFFCGRAADRRPAHPPAPRRRRRFRRAGCGTRREARVLRSSMIVLPGARSFFASPAGFSRGFGLAPRAVCIRADRMLPGRPKCCACGARDTPDRPRRRAAGTLFEKSRA